MHVLLCERAEAKFRARVEPLGVSREEFCILLRLPNVARPDRWDPDEPSRIRRWIRVGGPAGRGVTLRVVFVVVEPQDDMLPGAIEVITVFPDD